MKKIYLVVQDKDVLAALGILREAGTVHVEHVQPPAGDKVAELRDDAHRLERVIVYLSQVEEPAEQRLLNVPWQEKAQKISAGLHSLHQLREELGKRRTQMSQWEPWGDFCPQDIADLQQQGLYVYLTELTDADMARLRDDDVVQTLSSGKGKSRCVIVTRNKEKPPFAVQPLPPASLSDLRRQQQADEQRIRQIEVALQAEGLYLKGLRQVLVNVQDELNFQQVYAGRGAEEKLAFLKGYCPVEHCGELEQLSREHCWALQVLDPAEEDNVPTLLCNPRWVRLIQPVFQFADILPGYKELDVSMWFLLFFAMFSGILIGDAGYGMIFLFLIAAFHIANKGKVTDKKPFFLGYTLSLCAILWGVWTGTFFGQAWLHEGILRPGIPWLLDEENFQLFCFIVGAVHLSIAHIWRAVRKAPDLRFLSDVGWVSFIWGMFFVARMLVLGHDLPSLTTALLAAGAFLVLFFTKPSLNPLVSLKAVGFNIVFDFINAFTDIISYIRLFAVSLATVAVADAANSMSIFWIIFLHALNLMLAVLAIMVHGFRLNILEFSRHLEMEWTGLQYHPFRIRRI